jgi:FixJ family two-component response regulator
MSKNPSPTIYVIDDENSMRHAISLLLKTVGYNPVAFAQPNEFLANHDPNVHGCVVLDIRMPHMSGLEIQQHLNHAGTLLPVIFISGHSDVPIAVQAMRDGAFDFLTKPFRDQQLLDCINKALAQDAESRAAIQQHADVRARCDSLTPREREVFSFIVAGKANKVVAIDLGLSERTVEIHRSNLMEKMGARSVAQLVKMHLTLFAEKASA